jgi:butyrate kinase
MKHSLILVINPGSTSTKFAVYSEKKELLCETIRHSDEELAPFDSITDQYRFRSEIILSTLKREHIDPAFFSAVIGRGGLLKPIPGGVWEVNERMVEDLRAGVSGQHASNLGGIIAFELAGAASAPAYIADPVVVDELCDEARISGHPDLPRLSIFHALNQKATARRASAELGRPYEDCRLIVAHMGGGISVGAHIDGRVIDVNNALNGEGPFSPERSGTLPAGQLVELCFSGTRGKPEVMKMLKGAGGFKAYLGTADGKEVAERAEKGDEKADLLFRSMAYQVAKEIGAISTVLKGKADAIVLTGGLAFNKRLVELISERIAHLGRLFIYPGEDEMEALRDSALRALSGAEEVRTYK